MASLTLQDFRQNFPISTLGIPTLVLLIMAMFIVPLAPVVLDLLFTFNIVAALLIVMIAISTSRPMDFSAFPSILLLATLLRLALNVASTRIVLVDGHEGSDAAGKVIEAFGEFVIAGNYLVGFIIFSIVLYIGIIFLNGIQLMCEVLVLVSITPPLIPLAFPTLASFLGSARPA